MAEGAVIGHAEDHFLAALDHFTDHHALDKGIAHDSPGIGGDVREGFFRLFRGLDVDAHAADLGLVQDVWGQYLHHHREADPGGQLGRFPGGPGDRVLRELEPVVGEDLHGFFLAHLVDALLQDGSNGLGCRIEIIPARGELLRDHLLPGMLVRKPFESLHGELGIGEVRDGSVLQHVDGGPHPFFSHERRDDRLVRGLCRRNDRLGGLLHVRHGLGRKDDQDAVHVGVPGRLFEHGRIPLRRCVADDIHGIKDRGIGRQLERHGLDALPGHVRKGNAEPLGRIRRDNARAAGIGDHEQAVPAGDLALGKGHGRIKEVLHALGAHHAGLLEGGVEGNVGAGKGAGVGRSRARSGFGAAGFEQDDGFHLRGLLGDLHEPLAVHHVLDVTQDKAGFRIVHEVLDEVDLRKVRLVSEADELREPDLVPDGPVHDGDSHGSGLREKADGAPGQHVRGEGGVHVVGGIDEPQAVRPQDADVLLFRDPRQLFLEQRSVLARFLESRADDDCRPDAGSGAFPERRRYELGRNDDDRKVDLLADVRDLWIRFETQDLPARGIDRVDGALEVKFYKIVQDREADLLGVLRSADDGYGAGIKKGIKHGVSVVEKQRRVKARKAELPGTVAGMRKIT